MPIGVVSERLGHASPEFTLHRYSHVMPGMQREAADAVARAVRLGGDVIRQSRAAFVVHTRNNRAMADHRRESASTLEELLTSAEPAELANHLFIPSDRVLLAGTTAPAIAQFEVTRAGGLIVPNTARQPQPIDLVGTYVTLSDYTTDLPTELTSALRTSLVSHATFRQRITEVAAVNHHVINGSLDELAQAYASLLQPEIRTRLEIVLKLDSPARQLTARQPVLVAAREVIRSHNQASDEGQFGVAQALLLIHLASDDLNTEEREEAKFGPFDAGLTMEITRNEVFNRTEDPFALLARTHAMWNLYGLGIQEPLRESPNTLLAEATGLTSTEWLAFGFGLYAHRLGNPPGGPMWIPGNYFQSADEGTAQSFFSTIAGTPEEFAEAFIGADANWGLLPFEERPVVEVDGDFLVIDATLLIDRCTAGLFWYVHDNEARLDSKMRDAWTRAFAEMFETYVRSIAERLAPPLLGGGSTFYNEEDLSKLEGGKTADAGIDFGAEFVVFEIVGGRLTTRTRIGGDPVGLKADTEKLVYKKARQLSDTIDALLRSEVPLTGQEAPEHRRYYPVVVNLGTYPVNPMIASVIEEEVAVEGLFADVRVAPLSILDVGELEMVEGLSKSGGATLASILDQWRSSDLGRVSLRNYLLTSMSNANASDHRSELPQSLSRTSWGSCKRYSCPPRMSRASADRADGSWTCLIAV